MNGPDSHPDVAVILAERRELMRIAAQSALDRSRGGRDLSPDVRAWATHWAGVKPYGKPLGTGEPDSHARAFSGEVA